MNPLFATHSVCKSNNRCNCISKSKGEEQYKLLYFVEQSICSLCGRIEFQNQIHHIHHNRHKCLCNNCRESNRIYFLYNPSIRLHILCSVLKFFVKLYMEYKQKYRRCYLSNYCCICSSLHPHFRNWSNTINHNWIKNNIQHCTHNLPYCRI